MRLREEIEFLRKSAAALHAIASTEPHLTAELSPLAEQIDAQAAEFERDLAPQRLACDFRRPSIAQHNRFLHRPQPIRNPCRHRRRNP
jgi:hypothetical protein